MKDVYQQLVSIVGPAYASNHPEERFFYSRDGGTMEPREPDFVVMPNTTDEVQQIMKLANEREIPVVPMGGGLVLSGLSRPLKGGIVLDMKRMNRILEVNETSRYVVVEAGASQGMLQAYLKKHHPKLKHSVPDAPPIATIAGNVLIHGSGHLSAMGGFHTDMLNGLEVVLPTGEMVRIGSCSTSPYWFSRSPLPDLSGLFLGWAGTTGVATKLAIKLYPNRPFNDVIIFVTEDPEIVPDVIHRLSGVAVAEDILAWMTPKPVWAHGFQMLNVNYGAESRRELTLKRDLLRESVRKYIDEKVGGFMPLPPDMKKRFLEAPASTLAVFADVNKGGGFEYVGGIMPIELFPEAYRKGLEIASKHAVTYSLGARIIGLGHCMMFFYAYAFNRADEADVKRAQQALEDTNAMVLEMGGIPWKAEAPAQKQIINKMHPPTYELMNRIRAVLDPKGIMNPGNWEVS
ncbi:MAG: FAD-binding oxidoreductase [Desulfobacteraceae bacterium]|nr:FAD-binding oxidoreductase [Desulfobacteraceae bacterium]